MERFKGAHTFQLTPFIPCDKTADEVKGPFSKKYAKYGVRPYIEIRGQALHLTLLFVVFDCSADGCVTDTEGSANFLEGVVLA